MVNAGIGLIKKTELDIRYLPNYNFSLGFIGKGSVNLWGIGLKHDLITIYPNCWKYNTFRFIISIWTYKF